MKEKSLAERDNTFSKGQAPIRRRLPPWISQHRHLVAALLAASIALVAYLVALPFVIYLGPAAVYAEMLGMRAPHDGARPSPAPSLCFQSAALPVAFILGPIYCIGLLLDVFVYMPLIHALYSAATCCRTTQTADKRRVHNSSTTEDKRVTSNPPAERVTQSQERDAPFSTAQVARYDECMALLRALESPVGSADADRDVRLLKLSWLLSLGRKGGVLKRRQDLPEEAFMSLEELQTIEANARTFWIASLPNFSLGIASIFSGLFSFLANPDGLIPIVSISYCWLEKEHPDSEGIQLKAIVEKLDRKIFGSKSFFDACRAYGFSDMGVFLDFGSLFQACKVPGMERKRTIYEEQAFKRALHDTMDLWYAHSRVTVILVTEMPKGLPAHVDTTRTYHTRGWTTYEYCCAQLVKSEVQYASWNLVIDLSSVDGTVKRILPTTPERFRKLIMEKSFTNNADAGVVSDLYTSMATEVLGTIKGWSFVGSPLLIKEGDGMQLSDALNFCHNLQTLNLTATGLSDEAMVSLCDTLNHGALPRLQNLVLGYARFTAVGCAALLNALVEKDVAPRLRGLSMPFSRVEDTGVCLLAKYITKRMRHLVFVDLFGSGMTNVGAKAMADAIVARFFSHRLASLVKFAWGGNGGQIGLVGRFHLVEALEVAGIASGWYVSGHSSGGFHTRFMVMSGCLGARIAAEDRHGSIARKIWPARLAWIPTLAPVVDDFGAIKLDVSLLGTHKMMRLSKLALRSSLEVESTLARLPPT